jgi:hypothetical protein
LPDAANSIAITPPFASAATSFALSRPNAASSAFGSSMRKYSGERVVRGNAVPELQKALEELEFRASELGHFRAVLRTAQYGQEGD